MSVAASPRQAALDAANADFWDEVCGSTFARARGLTDRSKETLARFDQAFFDFYPYLDRHIPFASFRGKDVLEVGLGYGSVAQRIAEAGARYAGLDIARGPLAMARQRLDFGGLGGRLAQGSVLQAPFADASFDYVVAIGCYHHTGDFERALAETWRLLRPGGGATVMVYYAYSYYRWLRFPLESLRLSRAEAAGARAAEERGSSARERRAYDTDLSGRAAPVTEFISRRRIAAAASAAGFRGCRMALENAHLPRTALFRDAFCATLGRAWGRDVYVRLER